MTFFEEFVIRESFPAVAEKDQLRLTDGERVWEVLVTMDAQNINLPLTASLVLVPCSANTDFHKLERWEMDARLRDYKAFARKQHAVLTIYRRARTKKAKAVVYKVFDYSAS